VSQEHPEFFCTSHKAWRGAGVSRIREDHSWRTDPIRVCSIGKRKTLGRLKQTQEGYLLERLLCLSNGFAMHGYPCLQGPQSSLTTYSGLVMCFAHPHKMQFPNIDQFGKQCTVRSIVRSQASVRPM
jgi:hypothetical protein